MKRERKSKSKLYECTGPCRRKLTKDKMKWFPDPVHKGSKYPICIECYEKEGKNMKNKVHRGKMESAMRKIMPLVIASLMWLSCSAQELFTVRCPSCKRPFTGPSLSIATNSFQLAPGGTNYHRLVKLKCPSCEAKFTAKNMAYVSNEPEVIAESVQVPPMPQHFMRPPQIPVHLLSTNSGANTNFYVLSTPSGHTLKLVPMTVYTPAELVHLYSTNKDRVRLIIIEPKGK